MLEKSLHFAWLAGLSFVFLAGCTESSDSTGSGKKNAGSGAGTESGSGAGAEASATVRGTRRIILLNNTESPFWDAARAGIAKAAEDLKLEENGFTAGMDSNNGR